MKIDFTVGTLKPIAPGGLAVSHYEPMPPWQPKFFPTPKGTRPKPPKHKRMQCKHIPTLPVLEFLRDLPWLDCGSYRVQRTGTWFGIDNVGRGALFTNSVQHGMPPDVVDKLALAKMRSLIAKGLVDGCDCGCRGDFTLTDKGRALLKQ